MDFGELEAKLWKNFRQKPFFPWWPALRFKPSSYDQVFQLCVTHLTETFDELKAANFEISTRPGSPSSEFYLTLDLLEHLSKSIQRTSYFPWKSPPFWIAIMVLLSLFGDPYQPFVWWLVLAQTLLVFVWTIGDRV